MDMWLYDTVDRLSRRAPREWIAALSPVVAAPLVEWLRFEAADARGNAVIAGSGPVTDKFLADRYGPALRFARLVLGEPEQPPRCPTCGPTTLEPHPRREGAGRCSNCKGVLRG